MGRTVVRRLHAVVLVAGFALAGCDSTEPDSTEPDPTEASSFTTVTHGSTPTFAASTSASPSRGTVAASTVSAAPPPSTAPSTTPSAGTTASAADDPAVELSTVTAERFVAVGDPVAVCTAAVRHVAPNDSPWEGEVVEDVTFPTDGRSGRWLFCRGEGVGGVIAMWTDNDREWRLADLGFGFVFHAGDSIDVVAFDGSRAAVTYDTMVGLDHDHAWTVDAGQTWTTMSNVE